MANVVKLLQAVDEFAKVADFPYLVVYHEIGPDTYEIVAISHTSRDPDYWRTRVPGGE